MNKEVSFYLNVLSDFINDRNTVEVKDINWDLIKEYALNQNTNGIVYYKCKDFMPSDVLNYFNRLYLAELFNYGQRNNLTKELCNNFEKENITYCLIKGPIVSSFYPIPALRTMGDSDFVVKEEDKEVAYRIMDDLGYELVASLNERAYYKNRLEFEIHDCLVKEECKEKEFTDNIWNYVKDNKLDDNFHFIFLLIHIKNHLIVSGVGFRQFMDLAVEIQNVDLNWNFIETEVEKIGLTKFMKTCLSLTHKWFNVKRADKDPTELDESFVEETTLKFLKNGVQGFNDEDNDLNSAFEIMNKDENINVFSKIKYMFELYFPPLSYFKNDANYEFVRKCPLLLPVAWIYRFVLSVKNNNATFEIKRSIKSLFMSKKEIDKRLNDKDKWGL